MFGSEKKRQALQEEAERRIAEAGLREQERINAEKAERAGKDPGTLHKIGYLDTKLNEREERKDIKRVEKAQKREAKKIRKEQTRKYWWLSLAVFALIAGGVGGFLLSGHMDHKADYKIATDLIIAKDFKAAGMLLEDLKYKDSEKLSTYIELRGGLDQYDGHLDEYLEALEKLGSMDNKDIDAQFKAFVDKVRPAGEIQATINGLDIASLTASDAPLLEDLDKKIENLNDRYSSLLDTRKLQEAKVKMATLQETTEQPDETTETNPYQDQTTTDESQESGAPDTDATDESTTNSNNLFQSTPEEDNQE